MGGGVSKYHLNNSFEKDVLGEGSLYSQNQRFDGQGSNLLIAASRNNNNMTMSNGKMFLDPSIEQFQTY